MQKHPENLMQTGEERPLKNAPLKGQVGKKQQRAPRSFEKSDKRPQNCGGEKRKRGSPFPDPDCAKKPTSLFFPAASFRNGRLRLPFLLAGSKQLLLFFWSV